MTNMVRDVSCLKKLPAGGAQAFMLSELQAMGLAHALGVQLSVAGECCRAAPASGGTGNDSWCEVLIKHLWGIHCFVQRARGGPLQASWAAAYQRSHADQLLRA